MKSQRSTVVVFTTLFLFLSFGMLESARAAVPYSNFLKSLSVLADPDGNYWHDSPRMMVSNQFVHVTWFARKVADGNVGAIFYIRSSDGGKTFGPAQKPLEATGYDRPSLPGIAGGNSFVADGANVLIFFKNDYPGNLHYIRSADNGGTFTPAVPVFPANTADSIQVAAAGGNIAVGFSINENSPAPKIVYGMNSSDGGATFSSSIVVTPVGGYSHSIVDAVRSGSYVYFLTLSLETSEWASPTRLWLYSSWDGGTTFKPPVQVTVPASDGKPYGKGVQSANYSPNLFAEGKTVNIVWQNNDSPPTDYNWYAPTLRNCRSTDGGLTLTGPTTLHTYPVGYDSSPTFGQETIAGKGPNLYITTVLETPLSATEPAGTYVWRSADGGASWGAAQMVAPGGWWPHIGVDPTDSSTIHLVNDWYFRSLDAGETFTGGVNPHLNFGGWNYPYMSISDDGVVHYCGVVGGPYDGQISYRRIAPEPDSGSLNQALSLVKTSSTRQDNIQIPAFSNINFSTRMTVEFWVQRTSDSWPYFMNMVSKKRVSSDYGSYMVGTWSDFQIYGRLVTEQTDPNGGAFMGTGVTLPKDAWTHIAMTYDAGLSASNWKMFVNGLLANQMDMKGAILNETGFFPLVVGGTPNALETGSMKIDELRLWDRPLSESEIGENMSRELAGSEVGLSAYYNFNDTFKELTGKGFDAIPMYFETFVASIIPFDMNCDGVVNAADWSLLANFVVSGLARLPYGAASADVNRDGRVDALDLTAMATEVSKP